MNWIELNSIWNFKLPAASEREIWKRTVDVIPEIVQRGRGGWIMMGRAAACESGLYPRNALIEI